MKKIAMLGIGALSLILLYSSCKKTDSSTTTQTDDSSFVNGLYIAKTSNLQINFTYGFGNESLVFNDKKYVNASNDTFNIEDLKHYFSNLALQKADSSWIYFQNINLVDVKNGRNLTLNFPGVPAGAYRAIAFDLGIDKTHNSSTSFEGDLDPAWGMYWTWNTGYVFFRMMGRKPSTQEGYSLDIGGDNNLPHLVLPLTGFKVKSEQPQATILMDLNELFQNPSNYSFVNDGMVIHSNTSPGAIKLAKNMEDMAKVVSLK
jgi:hypothetical protein